MWGKGLLSSIVRGSCLHWGSAVWVTKRAGVAFLVLCFSRWADALYIHNGRRKGVSSYKVTSCEGEAGIKLRLAITSGNRSAGVWAGRWEPHGKTLGKPKLTSQYLHSKITLETGSVIRELLDPWEGFLCCQLWWLISAVVAYLCLHADAPRVGAVAGHWSQAGNSSSAHGFRLRQVLKSCTDIYPSPQSHQSNSSLCWVLNK